MTECCKKCKYIDLCIKLKYPLTCNDQDECENYEAFLDGELQADDVNMA